MELSIAFGEPDLLTWAYQHDQPFQALDADSTA
jgi:hypothetical protein